jgi:predicted dehydrogenase
MMSAAHVHTAGYVANLRAIPGVEMIGIADDDGQRGRQFAQEFNTHFYESYDALLKDNPDGVIVCSENVKHRPLVEMAASAGVHVLCEKPLATTLEDADAMIDACRRAGVTLMTAFPMRFNTPLMEVKKALPSLGKVYGVNGRNQGECPRHHRAWFVDKHLAGGGAVMDHTVHLADILHWYFECEVLEVYAEVNQITYADEVDVETGGLIMLTMENGTFASIDCSWSKPPYYPTWGGLSLDLVAENGLVTVDAFKQVMTVYRHDVQRPLYNYWGSDANQGMLKEFITAIQEKRAASVTGMDGYRALAVTLAAYRSVETGEPVLLALT